jgi:hypothetical protein
VPTLPGEMKPTPSNGPLWYDIADHLDTTVREPKEGWKQAEYQGQYVFAQSTLDNNGIERRCMPPLESSFVVQLSGASPIQTADIEIYSAVSFSRERTDGRLVDSVELFYEFVNKGNAALRLLVNLPTDGSISTQVPIVSKPILLDTKQGLKYLARTNKEVTPQRASVVFYDQAGKEVVGIDTAGFYGLAEGNRELDPDKLWGSLPLRRPPPQAPSPR